ncbi:MAG: hypothetical protein OXC44_06960 [Proteobacteria bacterium]|nr:hypothetical protein [Pseudomonadota bacterium]
MSLPFSSYVYAESIFTQKIADFIAAHKKAFRFFGGVARYVVSDDLKAGVTKAHLYDPMINKAFREYSEHTAFRTIP